MLVDAGAISGNNPRYVAPRPDDSRSPGGWIIRYVLEMLKQDPAPALDFVLLTHFHSDHMGQISDDSRLSKSGKYRLSGISEVGEQIPIRKILDRGWPDYQYPSPLEARNVKNYRAFLSWQAEHNSLHVERFQPGRKNQIALVRAPELYPNFEVRNVMANGEVWTGVGTNTRQEFPPLGEIPPGDRPSENMCSAGFRYRRAVHRACDKAGVERLGVGGQLVIRPGLPQSRPRLSDYREYAAGRFPVASSLRRKIRLGGTN